MNKILLVCACALFVGSATTALASDKIRAQGIVQVLGDVANATVEFEDGDSCDVFPPNDNDAYLLRMEGRRGGYVRKVESSFAGFATIYEYLPTGKPWGAECPKGTRFVVWKVLERRSPNLLVFMSEYHYPW